MKLRTNAYAVALLAFLFSSGILAAEKKDEKADVKVFVTRSGTKFHVAGCKFVDKDSTAISLADTKGKYEPCAVCKPDATVYATKTGAKFHMKTCTHAGKDPLSMMLAEAKSRKLEPCKVCNPPDGK